jgi:hypothetical protein
MITRADKKQVISEHYRKLGKLGSKARADALTPKRRSEIASLGGLARKKKLDASKKSA